MTNSHRIKFETAIERIELAPFWKDPKGALERAIQCRDEVIDDCFAFAHETGRRVEDLLDLPR